MSPTYRDPKYTDIDNLIIKLSGGGMGNRGIADFLNVDGIKTVRGKVFTATLIVMKKREIRERTWILNYPDRIVIEDETIYRKSQILKIACLLPAVNGECREFAGWTR